VRYQDRGFKNKIAFPDLYVYCAWKILFKTVPFNAFLVNKKGKFKILTLIGSGERQI
jgi:hypothetical protein